MISWLLVVIVSYFFFALANLGDKLVLGGPPKPISYTFYVGLLSLVVLLFVPFVGLSFPGMQIIPWMIADGLVYVLGLYTLYSALAKFDVSKVITTIGATQSIFIFGLTWIFFGVQEMTPANYLAFFLLLVGSAIISLEKNQKTTENYIKITLLSSFLFSLDYIFQKIVYVSYPFLQGMIWMRLFVFLFTLVLLLRKKNRQEIFQKKNVSDKKTGIIFGFTHSSGGIANFLQSFAVSLAPIAFLPIVNSLRGLQYVFLFIMTLFLSYFFPKILQEKISKKILAQKIVSTILIVAGLALLVF